MSLLNTTQIRKQTLRSDALEPDSAYKVWLRSVVLGILAAVGALYFPNIFVLALSQEPNLFNVQIPPLETSSVLGFYAVLATVIVALAFSWQLGNKLLEQEFSEIQRKIKENSVVLLVAQLVAISAVAGSLLYSLGRIYPRWGIINSRDVFAVLAVLFFGVVLSLIGSLVAPTKSHFIAQAHVGLPGTIQKIKQMKISSEKLTEQNSPKPLNGSRKWAMYGGLVGIPLTSLGVAFFAVAMIWDVFDFPAFAFLPIAIIFVFYFIVFLAIPFAAVGVTSVFVALRWIALIVIALLVVSSISVTYEFGIGADRLDKVLGSALVVLAVGLTLLVPWARMRIPETSRRRNPFLKNIYFLRVHTFGQLIEGLKKHRELQVKRLATSTLTQSDSVPLQEKKVEILRGKVLVNMRRDCS